MTGLPLYQRLHEKLLQHQVLHADETTLQVLKEPDKRAQSKSYMWLYRTSGDAVSIVLYEYQPDRSKKRPATFWRALTAIFMLMVMKFIIAYLLRLSAVGLMHGANGMSFKSCGCYEQCCGERVAVLQ